MSITLLDKRIKSLSKEIAVLRSVRAVLVQKKQDPEGEYHPESLNVRLNKAVQEVKQGKTAGAGGAK